MKATNYAVLRLYECCSPSLIQTFEDEENAHEYARIMNNEDGHEHIVLKRMED